MAVYVGKADLEGVVITQNVVFDDHVPYVSGIEVNTAGFRKLGDETNPCTDILKRYRELGGEIITIGSDAHVKTSVAYDFGRAGTMLKELGYEYYCLFKNRFPEFVDL